MWTTNQYNAAIALFDGGWRAEDRDQLISEYGWSDKEADVMCAALEDVAVWAK